MLRYNTNIAGETQNTNLYENWDLSSMKVTMKTEFRSYERPIEQIKMINKYIVLRLRSSKIIATGQNK